MTASPPLRMTTTTKAVLRELAATDGLCGADIATSTDIGTGTVYPILRRLEGARLVKSRWEDHRTAPPGQPLRRFYTLTEAGRAKAKEIS